MILENTGGLLNNVISLVELKSIAGMVHLVRGQRVILGQDLSILYGVETKVLMQAVKRNIERFPDDFMFQLNDQEVKHLKSQFVTLNLATTRRSKPYAFTEQGVAMLSSVLRSQRAIEVNIVIMRVFVNIRKVIESNIELENKLNDLERKYADHDEKIQIVFAAIRELMASPESPKPPIGFKRLEE